MKHRQQQQKTFLFSVGISAINVLIRVPHVRTFNMPISLHPSNSAHVDSIEALKKNSNEYDEYNSNNNKTT